MAVSSVLWAAGGAVVGVLAFWKRDALGRALREFFMPPEQRLEEQFRKGEIDRAEYERRKKILASVL